MAQICSYCVWAAETCDLPLPWQWTGQQSAVLHGATLAQGQSGGAGGGG